MKWSAELMYVARNAHGVIVGVSEEKPEEYAPSIKRALEKACRASSNEQETERNQKIEQQIREYALRKKAAR